MADQPDYRDGVMLALFPPASLVAQLAVADGTPVEEFHLTLAYLGKVGAVDPDALLKAARSLAGRLPVEGWISGHARFTGDAQDVLVALVDSPDLEVLRRDALVALEANGLEPSLSHGYTPHMTIKYLDDQEKVPFERLDVGLVTFDKLSVVYGEDRTDLPFVARETAIMPYARTAYAQGWASSGGPMTERVKAGCIAAMELCCEHAHEPGILEVALHLGRLEGVWATVFERRFALIDRFEAELTKLWREAVKDLDVADAVIQIRQRLAIGEDSSDFLRQAKAVAREAAARLLAWLPSGATWQKLRDAMRSLVASGQAEGYADAIAIASIGKPGSGSKVGEAKTDQTLNFDFELAFQHAYDALENLGETWAQADPWLEKMLGRAADEFGRTLGDLAASGAEYEQMVNAGLDVLGMAAEGADAVGFMVDWALSAGMSQGALDLYRSENVELVTWMTAGDDRVCPICEGNGQDSPFPILDFPTMPAHPRCRCVSVAEITLGTAYDGYF